MLDYFIYYLAQRKKTKELAKMDNINQQDLAIQKSFLDVVAGIMWGPACLGSTSTTRIYLQQTRCHFGSSSNIMGIKA